MTMQRPNVIVYQEYEDMTVTPATPDLDVLVVGKAYQILDYLDDKEDCEASSVYGAEDGAIPGAGSSYTSPTAVILATPPNIESGAILDADSVSIYFDAGRAVITDSDSGPTYGVYTTGDNLFSAYDALPAADSRHFGTEEVLAGDILLVQSATSDYKKTVKELCYTLYDDTGGLDLLVNNVAAGDTVTISNDAAVTSRDGTYTVKRVLSATVLELVETVPGVGNVAAAPACDILIQAPSGTIRVTALANDTYDWCNLRTTTDFSTTAVWGDSREWRIEREFSDVALDATDFSVTGNSVTIDAALTTDLSSTLTALPVTYAEIYMEYMAQRTDLATINTITSTSQLVTLLGKLDARNPLAVGAYVAKLNTTTRVKVYGLGDFLTEELAYADFMDRISSEREVYAIVPLTYNTTVLASMKSMAENLADPDYVLSNGFKQKWRMIIGAIELETQKIIWDVEGGATTQQKADTAPTTGDDNYLKVAISGVKVGDFNLTSTTKLVPGDQLEFKLYDTTLLAHVTYLYTVAHYNSRTAGPIETVEVDADPTQIIGHRALPVWGAGPNTFDNWKAGYSMNAGAVVGETFRVLDSDGVEKLAAQTPVLGNMTLTAACNDNYYLRLLAPGATFLTSGVLPGDYLQMSTDCESDPSDWDDATLETWTINEVLSEERLEIRNEGSNTSTVSNELPHLMKRVLVGGALGAVTDGAVYFRIMRDMDKTQQVDAMIAVASSFASKRLILAYPSRVDVSGLLDGSKDRGTSTTAVSADPQPGYYLSCVIGGQTAGQPSQQGFTNMGIAGIPRVYDASEYFTEKQLTDLSNGGVYVFIQDNPAALPYTIHEVTTDTTALETGEYMNIKNFDFISWTFLDVLEPFLGVWNVTSQTLEFVRNALKTTIDNLKARHVARIGAPLIDANIDSVAESTRSSDRVEAYVTVELPMVLNTIGLHLVA
jgi:hypothetical protein